MIFVSKVNIIRHTSYCTIIKVYAYPLKFDEESTGAVIKSPDTIILPFHCSMNIGKSPMISSPVVLAYSAPYIKSKLSTKSKSKNEKEIFDIEVTRVNP